MSSSALPLHAILLYVNVHHYADVLIISVTLIRIYVGQLKVRSHNPHPPGPPGLPFIGNSFDMPMSNEWLKASEWKERYGSSLSLSIMWWSSWRLSLGDLVYVEIFGKPMSFVNSYEAASDLLETRACGIL